METLKMARALLLLAALLLVCALGVCAAAETKCKAKYRYQWMYKLKDPSKANLDAMDNLVQKWMKEDCGRVLAYGQGAAVSTKPGAFGIAAASPTVEFADYGAWSDWASLDDLHSCYTKGIASGNIAAVRKFVAKASRLTYELAECPPGPTGHSPAAVRYLFNFRLSDLSPATCAKATALQAKITTGLNAMRNGDGCDSFNGDTKVYGPNVPLTADYGGYLDFKSSADMLGYLSTTNKPADIVAARTDIRKLAASTMRTAIALPATSFVGSEVAAAAGDRDSSKGGNAKVAKERGAMP